MSIWKSPIFYFGVLLLLLVGAALAAPFVVNWNSYRDTLESYGRNLTGRDVTIAGDISAQLYPWPRLVLNDVSIANSPQFGRDSFATVERLTMQLNLASLLGGEINVDTIAVDHPILNLARHSAGQFNWIFSPDQALQKSKLLDQVKLDQIIISDGEVSLHDQMHNFDAGISQLNVKMSASGVEGPWRIIGTARQGDVPLAVSFSSRVFEQGKPFAFGLKLEPQDGTLPAFIFDGEVLAENIQGKLRLEPVVTADGRESLEGTFKPLKLQAELKANFDQVTLQEIQIVPVDSKDNGTLIQGSATARFGNGIKAQVILDSPRIDLDALAGSQSLRVWRAGGVMGVLNSLLKDFPEKLDVTTSLTVASLSAARDTVENLRLNIVAERNAIRVKELSGNLPGRSRMKFDGVAFPGDLTAQLGGSLAFESNDARQFVQWLWPEGKDKLAKIWTGSRGRFKSQSHVDWSGQHFYLQDLKYEMDGAGGEATLAVQLGALAALDLKLKTKLLDIDNYLQGGLISFVKGSGLGGLLQIEGDFDKRFAVQADLMRVNGVDAQNVGLEFESSMSGFNIKKIEIGSVEGASLLGQGTVLQSPEGPSGDLRAKLNASDPRGFLHLLGVTGKGAEPQWTQVLGNTAIEAVLSFVPNATDPKMNFELSGTSGPLQVAVAGSVQKIDMGLDANLSLNADIKSRDGSDVLKIFGWPIVNSSDVPGRVSVTAAGSQTAGFKTNFVLESLNAELGYVGLAKIGDGFPSLDGKLVLNTKDGSALVKSLGVPLSNTGGGIVQLKANVSPLDGGLNLTEIEGQVATQNVVGNLQVSRENKLSGDFSFDSAHLNDVLAATFMPWRGKAAELSDSFSNGYGWLDGEVWLHPTHLQTDFGDDLAEAVIGISFDRSSRQATVAARDAAAEPVKLDIKITPSETSFDVQGTAHLALDLGRVLKSKSGEALAQGSAIFDANLTGTGRSPMAAISNFNGDASYTLRDARFTKISPQLFFPMVKKAASADQLQAALTALQDGPGFDLSAQKLGITVQNGALSFENLNMEVPDAKLKITPRYDFSTHEFETSVDIFANDEKAIPPLRVVYSGLLGALQVRSDTAALATKFGYDFMARDLAELERVQKEQARIAAEELAQQKADEIKFAAYQAQRNELRLRQREQRVFAGQRIIDAERAKARWAKIMAAAAALTKIEMRKYLRQLPARN